MWRAGSVSPTTRLHTMRMATPLLDRINPRGSGRSMWRRPRVAECSRTNPPETTVWDLPISERFLSSRSPDCSACKHMLSRDGIVTPHDEDADEEEDPAPAATSQ